MDARELVRQEMNRMLDGGNFNEGFWQSLYNPSRNAMYEAQRVRDYEVSLLAAYARTMADQAAVGGVVEKRKARKAEAKVRKAKGVLRARKMQRIPDEINLAWRNSVQWIADARDAAVYIARMNQSMKSPDAILDYEPPKPIVYKDDEPNEPKPARRKPVSMAARRAASKKKGRANVAS